MFKASELLNNKKNRALIKWGLLGLLIRMLFMPFTMHSDILFINYFPLFLSHHGVFDIYSYLKTHFADQISTLGWFYYPPLTYFTFGFFQFIFRPLTPLFEAWMNGVGLLLTSGGGFTQHYTSIGTSQIYRNIFFMKLPYLFFDASAAILILQFFDDWKESLSAFKLWVFNPVIIYVCYIFGQFDIMPAFFMLLCFYFVKKDSPRAAILSLGMGAAFKNFPFLFLLPLAVLLGKNNLERMKLVALGLLPYFILLLPLYFSSGGFVKFALFPKVMGSKFDMRLGEKMIFAIAYIAIIINAFFKSGSPKRLQLSVDYYLIIFTFFYALFPPSFHYYMWITPAIVIAMVNNRNLTWLYFIQATSLFILKSKNKFLFFGLFAPVHPSFSGLPALKDYLDYVTRGGIRDIVNLAFLISSIIMVYCLYKDIKNAKFKKA